MAPTRSPRGDPLRLFGLTKWIDRRPLPDTMEPFRRQIFREVFTARLPDGRLRYNLALISRAKKNWKSTDLILAGFVKLLGDESPHGNQCLIYANDEDQAGDDLDLAVKLVRANPAIEAAVTVKAKRIERRDGAGFLEIQPRDAIGSHGKTFRFCGFDEIHGYRDWSLLEALQPDPSRDGDTLTWITSYAGYDQRQGSPLWDLYQAGLKGRDERMFFDWRAGDGANPAAIVTPEYLAQQRQRLPDGLYRRLHRNEWTSGMGGLWTLDQWDACVHPDHRPLLPTKAVPVYVGVDASTKRDRTAVVGVTRDGDRVRLAFARFWQPSRTDPMDLEATAEKVLREIRAAYLLQLVRYDPHQFHRSATTLKADGLPMEEYVQSTPNLEDMAQSLFDAVRFRTLALYPDPALREEAGAAVAVQTRNEKFYISKEKSGQKVDQIVALAMATHAALQRAWVGDIWAGAPPVPVDPHVAEVNRQIRLQEAVHRIEARARRFERERM